MPARLTVHLPFQATRTYLADEGRPLVLGRDPECDLGLDDDRVSRRHARLASDDESWWLEDLGSKNGTAVNGRPVERERLADGDWISLGGLLARFELVSPEARDADADARARRWRTTLSLQRKLDPSEGLERLLERVLESALSLSGGQRGFVMLGRPGGDLEVVTRAGLDREGLEAEEFAGSVGAIDRALRLGRSVAVSDALAETFLQERPSIVGGGIRGLVCVPLEALGRVLGVLYLDSREPGASFGELDLEILEALASHGALAIAVARLDEELKGLASSLPTEPGLDETTLRRKIGTVWDRAVPACGSPSAGQIREIAPAEGITWSALAAHHRAAGARR